MLFLEVKSQDLSKNNLGLKTLLNKIPLLGDIFFWVYKINEILNTFLLAWDKFIPEMHLKQPGFIYSACGLFTKTMKGLKNLCKQALQILLTKAILINLFFNMIRPMVNIKIWQKERVQMKFWKIKLFKLQVIQIMMDIKKD